jgi:hypothetical protein
MKKRTIKPEFFKDPKTGRLNSTTQILFIGMWCMADRQGYIEFDEDLIKSEILPYYKQSIKNNIQELIDKKLVIKCNYKEKKLIYITNFIKHQPIHPHEAKSPYPPIDSEDVIKCNYNVIKCNEMGLHPNSNSKGKGIGNNKDIGSNINNLQKFENWKFEEDEKFYEWSKEKGYSYKQIKEKQEQIVLYCRSKGKTYKDYKATLQNWLNRDAKDTRKKQKNFDDLRKENFEIYNNINLED